MLPTLRCLSSADSHDVLARLRAATHEQHTRLDAGLSIAAPTAGMDAYRAHLRLLWGWLAPLQQWLDAHEGGPQDPGLLARSPRLQWLADDLAEVDAAPTRTSAESVRAPACSSEFRWGVCYVIEGSQLGGRALLRKLAPRLAPHRPRLLAGGGADVQSTRWHEFLDALRREVRTPSAIAQACAGARFAFDRILGLAGLDATASLVALGEGS
jgi:heme oxygenase